MLNKNAAYEKLVEGKREKATNRLKPNLVNR